MDNNSDESNDNDKKREKIKAKDKLNGTKEEIKALR